MSDDTQRPLFGMPLPKPEYPRRIVVMWGMYGKSEGHTCKTCVHLVQYSQANTWYKCGRSHDSGGPGTDWRVSWPACGRWVQESEA